MGRSRAVIASDGLIDESALYEAYLERFSENERAVLELIRADRERSETPPRTKTVAGFPTQQS